VQLTALYRGGNDPFEGDRAVPFRGLPAGAHVSRAVLKVTPVGAVPAPPRLPFEEIFVFDTPRDGELAAADWGVTAATTNTSVEVDLHARRTLAVVTGANISGSALTVDVGGLFVELNALGAVRAPGDPAFPMAASGALPGVTVPRFRLTATGAGAVAPSVDTVAIRSAPANVAVRLGTLGPFWTYVGELTARQATPDFAETLQAFLLQAKVENGSYLVPFVVHADGIARLDLALELEFVQEQSVLPEGLAEVTLPFDLSTFASSGGSLSVRLPAGAQVVPGATAARVRGAFDSTRIAPGAGTGDVTPTGEAVITAERGAAQAVEPAGDVVVTGFDLFLDPLTPTARLNVTVLGDSDGKPFGEPLLPAPLEISLSREESRAAKWVTVPLGEPFNVEAGRRYWLVLQAIAGEASWPAVTAAAGTTPLQASTDAGLSWSTATDAHVTGPLAALHRLRVTPAGFKMPISVDVGSGPATQHVSLRRFEPLGRIDLTIDTPELAAAFESAATAAGPGACPTAEHVVNGELDQWIGVGDDLQAAQPIFLQGSPRALALTRDGSRAYVGSFAAGSSELEVIRALLEPVDLACGRAAAPIVLEGQVTVEPVLVALDPQGTRGYVVGDVDGGAWLVIADLAAAASIGKPVPLDSYVGVALAPDGGRLFLLRVDHATAVIDALDARTAERMAREGKGGLSGAVTPVASVQLQAGESLAGGLPTPFAAAADGDATLLAFALDGHTPTGRLCLLTAEQPDAPQFVEVGRGPAALASTRDGTRIAVACAGDKTLSVLSGGAAASAATPIALAATPVAVTLSADGARAAVLSDSDVAVYDLGTGRQVSSAPAGESPTAVAGSPRLDVLLVAESEGGALARYAVPAVPLEWTLTSGSVEPRCFSGDLSALLGRSTPRLSTTRTQVTRREPSAISQVVPVSGGCRYEFSFRALADQPDSVGELLWRAGDCGLSRADRVPIVEFERTSAKRRATGEPRLQLHRAVFQAPAGVGQAEIRFSAPPGGLAAVGFVSLKGTDAAGVNDDLQQRQNGQVVGWASDPAGADVSLGASDTGVRVANEQANAGALVQQVAVTAGRTLSVELTVRATASGAAPGPELELRFLDASGAAKSDPATVPLSREAFDRVLLAVEAPADSVNAEVRLELPPGAAIELDRITLREQQDVEVPLVFRSEAPGELAVAAARVAYDTPARPAPEIPSTGLCPPTAPGDAPGSGPKPACGCCGSHESQDEARAVVTPSGRPAILGRCASCGCRTVSVSGRPDPRAPVLAPSRPLGHALGVGLPTEPGVAAHALVDVIGIGPIRARRLARVGIATVERLAVAKPPVVATILGGVSRKAATAMIDSARSLAGEELSDGR
jgi:DNA-binding beta-propeller fold protein YncE